MPLEHVGAVDPGIGNPDQHLSRTGSGQRNLLRLQHLRPAGRGDGDRGHSLRQFHRLSPLLHPRHVHSPNRDPY